MKRIDLHEFIVSATGMDCDYAEYTPATADLPATHHVDLADGDHITNGGTRSRDNVVPPPLFPNRPHRESTQKRPKRWSARIDFEAESYGLGSTLSPGAVYRLGGL